MADPLSLLRQYNIHRKQIVERDGNIIFGEFSWPKTVKTNYVIWGTGKDGSPKEYYTLECLLYLLNNINLQHPVYVRQSASEDIPIVRRPDRKDLLAYLKGDTQTAAAIDKSAPLEMPTQVKRGAEDNLESDKIKKLRIDESTSQMIKSQLAKKYGAAADGGNLVATGNIKALSEELTPNKIAEIKAKMFAKRRTRIKAGEDDTEKGGLISFADLESDRTKEILGRERQWRTRTTILQSNGKQFAKNVLAILASVKAREEGRSGKPMAPPPSTPRVGGAMGPPASRPQALMTYDRYQQEQLRQADTEGFTIDTTGTYAGMTLKSVTEGSDKRRLAQQQELQKQQAAQAVQQIPRPTPAPKPVVQQKGSKRVSRTPIIIIPAAPKSLITMFNARDVLQDLRFVSTEDKRAAGGKRDNELLIQRRKEGGLTVPYRILDNPGKLNNAEWDRVVAVFVMGQAWQFKGWPWDGSPVEIFSKIAGYHLKWDETNLEKNIANWAVTVIQLSRTRRHLDRAALMTFWEKLDKHMVKNKPHLRF